MSFSAKIQFYFLRGVHNNCSSIGAKRCTTDLICLHVQSGEAAEPSFAVVGDVEDPFGPLPPNQWLMSVHQSKAQVGRRLCAPLVSATKFHHLRTQQIDKVLDALPDLAASSPSSDLTASIAALEVRIHTDKLVIWDIFRPS